MLSSWDAGVLSQAFGIGRDEVITDAKLIATARHAPLDDVIALLRKRHGWNAATAYRYLRTLRVALRGGPISLELRTV
jgi:hypothetical protein